VDYSASKFDSNQTKIYIKEKLFGQKGFSGMGINHFVLVALHSHLIACLLFFELVAL